jgi:hypothetical protein
MDTAEKYAVPVHGNLGGSFVRTNDFNEKFHLRWGKIIFDVWFGAQVNLKVILRVYRDHNICETYVIDTDPYDIEWNHHKRRTRDFYIHPSSNSFGHVNCVKFAFVAHRQRAFAAFAVRIHLHGLGPVALGAAAIPTNHPRMGHAQ